MTRILRGGSGCQQRVGFTAKLLVTFRAEIDGALDNAGGRVIGAGLTAIRTTAPGLRFLRGEACGRLPSLSYTRREAKGHEQSVQADVGLRGIDPWASNHESVVRLTSLRTRTKALTISACRVAARCQRDADLPIMGPPVEKVPGSLQPGRRGTSQLCSYGPNLGQTGYLDLRGCPRLPPGCFFQHAGPFHAPVSKVLSADQCSVACPASCSAR